MDFETCLGRMKSPADSRPSIWRGGVLQIMITRACDQACFACTQGSNLAGKPVMMSVEQADEAFASLKGYFGVVGIFGGNPAMHPQFAEICGTMAKHIPYEQRGVWCNNPRGKGRIMRETFNPAVCNINVHLSAEAALEFETDWPECKPYIKGLKTDSRHSPPYVAMQDLGIPEGEMWELVSKCDVNQFWSALIGVFRGQLRGWFCEIAGAQSMLHADDPDYPDTGKPISPGWWKAGMAEFGEQVRKHCPACGIPLRGYGSLATIGDREQVSKTHEGIYRPKVKGRKVELVTTRAQLHEGALPRATDYVENSAIVENNMPTRRPEIREKRTAITVCWNYSDYLRHTLPINRKFFDDYIVIAGDSASQGVAFDNGASVHLVRFDGVFNKGLVLNKAIQCVSEGWIIHLDADIVMPFPLDTWEMIFAGMNTENIYGCDRLSVPSYELFEQGKENIDSNGYVHIPHAEIMPRFAFAKLGGWVPIGYWQAWHSKHKRFYPDNVEHAGDSDVVFAGQWPRSQRILLPEASVLHLETSDKVGTMNWFGRSTVPFGQSMQIG